jgi:hypothetical protein
MRTISDGPGNTPTGGNQNRKNRHNGNPDRRNRVNPRQHPTKFEGKTPGLKGYTYDIQQQGSGSNNADDFVRTTQEISEWIARNYVDGGADVSNAINPTKLEFDPFPPPIADPATTATAVEMIIWELELKQRRHEEVRRKQLSNVAYAIVLGQCSQAVRDRIEASHQWTAISTGNDVIGLLKLLRTLLFSGTIHDHHYISIS